MRRILAEIIGLLVLGASSGGCLCVLQDYEPAHRGKIIDAQTGEPIPGVVVLGLWKKRSLGDMRIVVDLVETVTDEEGEFSIGGKGVLTTFDLYPMDVVIFKAGYQHCGLTFWDSLRDAKYLDVDVRWVDGKAVVALRKLSREEIRKHRDVPILFSVPREKWARLWQEIEKHRKEAGIGPPPNRGTVGPPFSEPRF